MPLPLRRVGNPAVRRPLRPAGVARSGAALACLVCLVHACPRPCSAYRPFATEDAGVAGKGVLQMEASLDRVAHDGVAPETMFLLVGICGVTERLEVSMEVPYSHRSNPGGPDSRGLGDVNLVAKLLLLPETPRMPMVAMRGTVKTSSGAAHRGYGSGEQDVGLAVAASKTEGPCALHGMLGYTVVGSRGDDGRHDTFGFGAALDLALTSRWHAAGEIVGSSRADRAAAGLPLSAYAGILRAVGGRLALDAGARFGLTPGAPDLIAGVGASISF